MFFQQGSQESTGNNEHTRTGSPSMRHKIRKQLTKRLVTNISSGNNPSNIPNGYQIAKKIKSNKLASILAIENACVRDVEFFPTWSENELYVQVLRRDERKSELCLEYDGDSVRLQNLESEKDSIVRVFFPQFYGLDVSLDAGSITTHDKIEAKCGFVSLYTKRGDISVKKIRTERIELRAQRVEINAVAEGTRKKVIVITLSHKLNSEHTHTQVLYIQNAKAS